MTPLGNRMKRLIYAYEFSDNTVYVGLTFDLNERDRQHRKKENSQVYKHIKETGLEPEFKQITDEFVSALDAKILEQQTIEKYVDEGWKILNLAKAGGLGSSVLDNWTKDMVLEVSKKYNKRTEFCNKERRACLVAKRNGWYEEATNHMAVLKQDWDFEKIHNEALKYKNRNEFKKKSPQAYMAAHRNNIIDDVTTHMGQPKIFGPHNAIWDRDLAEKEIQKYKTISDLKSKNNSLYSAIHRFGWQDLLGSLESKITNWTPDKIFDEARKYNRVIEFRDGSPKAYGAAKRLNLIPDIRNIYGQKERLSPKR
jgi:predicted GIY-YIG superfamily endonuclease